MTVQEIHEYIWSYIIESYEDGYEGKLETCKGHAIDKLFEQGKITQDALGILYQENYCVCCALYESCGDCPLRTCSKYSWYRDAEEGDINAMRHIHDINVLSGDYPLEENKKTLEAT